MAREADTFARRQFVPEGVVGRVEPFRDSFFLLGIVARARFAALTTGT
jgi:hypothetical protein